MFQNYNNVTNLSIKALAAFWNVRLIDFLNITFFARIKGLSFSVHYCTPTVIALDTINRLYFHVGVMDGFFLSCPTWIDRKLMEGDEYFFYLSEMTDTSKGRCLDFFHEN